MIKIAVCEDEKETQLLIEDYLEAAPKFHNG